LAIRKSEIAALGCWVCRNQGIFSPATLHHVRRLATSKRRSKAPMLPLCPVHHQTGGYGVAIHAGRKAWEQNYGDEIEMVKAVYDYLRSSACLK
jgi:hypothetical protein